MRCTVGEDDMSRKVSLPEKDFDNLLELAGLGICKVHEQNPEDSKLNTFRRAFAVAVVNSEVV